MTLLIIPPGTAPSRCRSCGKTIYWVKTAIGRTMPVSVQADKPDHREPTTSAEGHGVSHFADCPDANRWRKDH